MSENVFFKKTLCYKNIYDDFNMDMSPSIIGYEVCNKNKPAIVSNKSCHLIHFVLKGKGYVSYNGKITTMTKDDCFLIEPYSNTIYRPDPDNPWSYVWLELNGDLTKKFCDSIGFKQNNMKIKIENTELIRSLLEKLFEDNNTMINQRAEALRIESILFSIFSVIINENYSESIGSTKNKNEQKIKQIIDYLNANYTSQDISVASVAKHFYFSPAYLTRIFKESNGISPMKYIIVLRMRRAAELIDKHTFSISQIAYALGYKNQFYFSKEFKKYYGVQPSKYVKEG